MIYLKSPNVLFLKPKKVAGTSFEMALSRFAGPRDILAPILRREEKERRGRGFRSRQNYRYWPWEIDRFMLKTTASELRYPFKFYNHMTAREARAALGEDIFRSALKVSIVRNPYDMLVSLYFGRNHGKRDDSSLREWLRTNSSAATFNEKHYYIDGEYVIDHMIRYESIGEDILELERIRPELTGLRETFETFSAKSERRPPDTQPEAMFGEDQDLIDLVGLLARPVMDRFGYELPRQPKNERAVSSLS